MIGRPSRPLGNDIWYLNRMEMCCVRVEQSVHIQWKINSTELLIRRRLNIYISNRLIWLSGFSKSLIVKWANFCDMRRRWLFYTIDFGSVHWLQMFSKEFRTNAWLHSDGFFSFSHTSETTKSDKKPKWNVELNVCKYFPFDESSAGHARLCLCLFSLYVVDNCQRFMIKPRAHSNSNLSIESH